MHPVDHYTISLAVHYVSTTATDAQRTARHVAKLPGSPYDASRHIATPTDTWRP
jgi:hypothetical protein